MNRIERKFMPNSAGQIAYTQKLPTLPCKIKDISDEDEYVEWLCFANAGMLDRGNLYCFDYAIRNLPSSAPLIEIGSFCGLSTNLITYYKKKCNVKNALITSDKWEFEGAYKDSTVGDSPITHAEYRMFVKETYIRNIRMFSKYDLPYTIELNSDDFFFMWSNSKKLIDVLGRNVQLGGAISFCYIDGNHAYECLGKECPAWRSDQLLLY
jgi:hypothetical protein